MLDSEFPQAALVSEWSYPPQALGAGFHADFLLDHGVMDVPAHVPPMQWQGDGALVMSANITIIKNTGGILI